MSADTITRVAGTILTELDSEIVETAITEFATRLASGRNAPVRVDFDIRNIIGLVDSVSYDASTGTAGWSGMIVEPWPPGPLDDEGRVILDASIAGRWKGPYPLRDHLIIDYLSVSRYPQ